MYKANTQIEIVLLFTSTVPMLSCNTKHTLRRAQIKEQNIKWKSLVAFIVSDKNQFQ